MNCCTLALLGSEQSLCRQALAETPSFFYIFQSLPSCCWWKANTLELKLHTTFQIGLFHLKATNKLSACDPYCETHVCMFSTVLCAHTSAKKVNGKHEETYQSLTFLTYTISYFYACFLFCFVFHLQLSAISPCHFVTRAHLWIIHEEQHIRLRWLKSNEA